MSDTITLIDADNAEAFRQTIRKLWADPNNVAFRRAVKMQTENYAWLTLGGADPLPEVKDAPICTVCFERAADEADGDRQRCYDCRVEQDLEDSEGPDW